VQQLDKLPEPDEVITPEDVQDVDRVARLFARILRDIARLTRAWKPRRVDYEDRSVDSTGTTKYRLEHRFGGRVRWWPVGWSGAAAPALSEHADSDTNTLVLTSTSAGTVTIRIEEAG
jgi:hypothetical protein